MRIPSIIIFVLCASGAIAQPVINPSPVALGCAYNTTIPAPTNNNFFYVQCDANGKLITSSQGKLQIPSISPVGAIVGDSIAAQNNASAAGQKMYSSRGWVSWLRFLTNQSIQIPYGHNLGVAGATLAQIAATVPTALALTPKPNFIFNEGGINDITNGTALTSMQDSIINIMKLEANAGVIGLFKTIPPYTGLSSDQQYKINAYNTWMRELGAGRSDILAAAGLPPGYVPIVIDATAALVDSTSASGAAQSRLTSDGVVHPNPAAGQIEGLMWQSALTGFFPSRNTRPLNLADIYNSTKNPNGNLLNNAGANAGMFVGTSGTLTTLTGVTPTGSLATGWQGFRNTGSSTATLVFSKENPRTDILGSNGERQIITIASNSGGLAYETYSIRIPLVAGSWSVGDTIYAEGAIEVVSATNLISTTLYCYESGPATPNNNSDMNDNSASGVLLNTTFSGVFRTEPFVVQSGTTNIYVQYNINLKSDVASAAAVVKVSDAQARKISN